MQVVCQEDQRCGFWPRSDLCDVFITELLLPLWLLELRYPRRQVEVSEFLVLFVASGGPQLLRRAREASGPQLQLAPASTLLVCDVGVTEAVQPLLDVLGLPVELSVLGGRMLPLVICFVIGF